MIGERPRFTSGVQRDSNWNETTTNFFEEGKQDFFYGKDGKMCSKNFQFSRDRQTVQAFSCFIIKVRNLFRKFCVTFSVVACTIKQELKMDFLESKKVHKT